VKRGNSTESAMEGLSLCEVEVNFAKQSDGAQFLKKLPFMSGEAKATEVKSADAPIKTVLLEHGTSVFWGQNQFALS
jgi:hypothetical protein